MSNIIGIGTDITEIGRIAQMIEKHEENFLRRVYTESEIQYCSARKSANQHFAGRWAAKESVLKAIGTGWTRGIRWTDIEIANHPGGQPFIRLGGEARVVCETNGVGDILISISHCKTFATAYAIAVRREE